jgi:hypothetical protein
MEPLGKTAELSSREVSSLSFEMTGELSIMGDTGAGGASPCITSLLAGVCLFERSEKSLLVVFVLLRHSEKSF